MGLLNLEEQLVFYRSYHFEKHNVRIHMVFVPTILISSLFLGAYVDLSSYFPSVPSPYEYSLNLATVVAIGYAVYYVLLDRLGWLTVPLLATWPTVSGYLIANDADSKLFRPALAVFVFAWIAQFYGHGVYEKRAPALLDNLTQALVLAPYFVLFEVFFILGYRTDLQKSVDLKAAARIKEFRMEAKKKK